VPLGRLWRFSLEKNEDQRVRQLEINQKFLMEITDSICYTLDPTFIGTWQQRAQRAEQKAKELQNLQQMNKTTRDAIAARKWDV